MIEWINLGLRCRCPAADATLAVINLIVHTTRSSNRVVAMAARRHSTESPGGNSLYYVVGLQTDATRRRKRSVVGRWIQFEEIENGMLRLLLEQNLAKISIQCTWEEKKCWEEQKKICNGRINIESEKVSFFLRQISNWTFPRHRTTPSSIALCDYGVTCRNRWSG